MTAISQLIRNLFRHLRYPFMLVFFLFTGNHHQAVEKWEQDRSLEMDLTFMYKPVVSFHPEYQSFIEGELDRILGQQRFNGSVMVAHKGQAVYNKTFGYAHLPSRTEFAENNNVFQLASVGKQFTAMATLVLYERGLFDLDDPLQMHLEGFPHEEITIRHLLNHTSGLQNYMYLLDRHWKKDELPTLEDMCEMMEKLPLNFRPGRRFSYSNTGYAFLALLVERLSGESFADFVQNQIFIPLGMKNSFVFHKGMDMEALHSQGLATGHERMGRGFRTIPVDHVDGIAGDKGIYSCTEDLLKWDNALEMNTLITEETKDMAFSKGKLRSGYAINYGFGFRIRQDDGKDTPYHHGWWRGFRTTYLRLPGNTLIVILNNTNASVNGLDRQIQNIISRSPWPQFTEDNILAMQ